MVRSKNAGEAGHDREVMVAALAFKVSRARVRLRTKAEAKAIDEDRGTLTARPWPVLLPPPERDEEFEQVA
jgi:hypothetical protein